MEKSEDKRGVWAPKGGQPHFTYVTQPAEDKKAVDDNADEGHDGTEGAGDDSHYDLQHRSTHPVTIQVH